MFGKSSGAFEGGREPEEGAALVGEGGIGWSARWMFHARDTVTTLVP